MGETRLAGRRVALVILLLVVIFASGITIWLRFPGSQTVEISLVSPEKLNGEIYISGAVMNPGIYPLKDGDSPGTLIRAAGGLAKDADLAMLKLFVPPREKVQPQKIDINRAEAWLLKALPEIGDSRAKAIIEYRNRQGSFKSTSELSRVEGMGFAIYEKIKDLITVGE